MQNFVFLAIITREPYSWHFLISILQTRSNA